MPESVTDRCTKSHEQIFLLTKSANYFFDAEAIKEPSLYPDDNRKARASLTQKRMPTGTTAGCRPGSATYSTRNARTVWTIPVQPLNENHYAAFPEELARRAILAGTSERGVCRSCAAPWGRILETILPSEESARPQAREAARRFKEAGLNNEHITAIRTVGISDTPRSQATTDGYGKNTEEMQQLAQEAKDALGGYYREYLTSEKKTVGWLPSCTCRAGYPVRAVVLDPFAGSGTTGRVALRSGRRAILIELNPEYTSLIDRRCQTTLGLFGLAEAEDI